MHKDFTLEDLELKQETTEHLLYSMIEVLHDAGFRVTTQRKIILEAIAKQVGWHVHPKDVFSYVQKKDETIGLATVYRTLKMLEDMDLLNKIYMMGQQNVHPNDANHDVHYHLICLKCGAIRDINDDMLKNISEHMKNEYGFSTTQTKLTLYGLCEDCERFMKKK